MKKQEFLSLLRERLRGLPKQDIEERVNFYEEMINDRLDDGKTEEEAINDLGGIDKVVGDIARETPLVKLVKEKMKPKRRMRGWEIVLLIIGFPLWFPLFLTGMILMLVGYLLVWILVIVTYTLEACFIAGAFGGLVAFAASYANGVPNFLTLGLALVSAGCAFFMIFACIGATKLSIRLSIGMVTGIKKAIIGKGN